LEMGQREVALNEKATFASDPEHVFGSSTTRLQPGQTSFAFSTNEVNPKAVLPYSRVIWLKLDKAAKTVTLIRSLHHPNNLSAVAQGNAQGLDNGATFVGWGQPGATPTVLTASVGRRHGFRGTSRRRPRDE